MFDPQGFGAIDATPVLADTAPINRVRTFPAFRESLSYEQLAIELTGFFMDELGQSPISKATLKNKWLSRDGRVTRIYEGLDAPPLKTESGRITPFGISATADFVLQVHVGSRAYEDYTADVRSRYPARIAEVQQDLEQPSTSAAIVPVRGSALAQYQAIEDAELLPVLPTFKHVSTETFVSTELAKINQLMDNSAAFDEQLDQELIQQALNRGAQRGAMLAKLEIAAAEQVRRQAIAEMGKKQGLTDETATP